MSAPRLRYSAPPGAAGPALPDDREPDPAATGRALLAWREAGAVVWFDAQAPTPAELEPLILTLDLQDLPTFAPAGAAAAPRPRLLHYGAYTLLRLYIAHPGTLAARGPTLTRLDPLLIVFGERFLLTIRDRPQPLVDRLAAAAATEGEVQRHAATWGATGLLHALLEAIVASQSDVLDYLTETAESREEALYATGSGARRALATLTRIRRDMFSLRRLASAQRSAFLLLARDPGISPLSHAAPGSAAPGAAAPATALGFDDVLDRAGRLEQAIGIQYDLQISARTAYHSWIAAGVTQATRTLLVTICLVSVPTMVTAVYGMNFARQPELSWTSGHLWAIAVALALDGALWLQFRRRGWV